MKSGQRVRPTDWLLVNFTTNPYGEMRCGWTLPRNVGSAVVRNRLKRWSRVYFRAMIVAGNEAPVDVNLVFRKAERDFYRKLNYEQFTEVLDRSWRQVKKRLK